ncbi:hypothetical protein TRAPUB_4084 [Trametes pubescens]|uniref:F-box domain-containing protein n=1 Tax=Trametes pubescens TaxID=154538 RepID=A0A1M2VC57_TRAPU|nr:hypothetical protein TRAPUB_4084 [Trametes pubescens]
MWHLSRGNLAAVLPCEILLQIFFASIPASHEYDHSISQGRNSSWSRLSLRTKRSLPRVCHAWHGPATEVLYFDVTLRRVEDVQALANTLRACSPDLGSQELVARERDLSSLIKHIGMDAFPVLVQDVEAVKQDLALILRRCTRLTAFHLHTSSAFATEDYVDQRAEYQLAECTPAWMFPLARAVEDEPSQPIPLSENQVANAFRERLSSSLREVDVLSSDPVDRCWRCELRIGSIHPFLGGAANTLVSLRLGRFFLDPDFDFNGPILVFNALEELYVYYSLPGVSHYMCAAWVLPRLEKLTLLQCESWRTLPPDEVLRAHGRRLRYLHIYPGLLGWPDEFARSSDDTALLLADLCPALEHVVLASKPARPLPLNHPALRYIDVWANGTGYEEDALIPTNIAALLRAAVVDEGRARLPNLRCVRMLLSCYEPAGLASTLLAPERHPDWPIVCHPAGFDGSDEDVFFRVFLGNWAVQTRWGVLSPSRDLCLPQRTDLWVQEEASDASSVASEAAAGDEELKDVMVDWKLPDEMQPDEDMLIAVLEEQGLEYSAETAEKEYVCGNPDSDGDSLNSQSTGNMYDEDINLDTTSRLRGL